MKVNERSIFLIDAAGAFLSAIVTGLICPYFSELLGLKIEILRALLIFPITYFLYSSYCYFFAKNIHRWMLGLLILANGLYCGLSLILVFALEGLTSYGQVFLVSEVIVIIYILSIEVRVFRLGHWLKR